MARLKQQNQSHKIWSIGFMMGLNSKEQIKRNIQLIKDSVLDIYMSASIYLNSDLR